MHSKELWMLIGTFIVLILITLSFNQSEGFSQINYSSYPTNVLTDGEVDQFSIAPVSAARKLTGFDGLFSAPEIQAAKPIDVFADTPGSVTAPPVSLSNSMGYLQFSKDQIQLLSTRGGNASGVNYGPV